MTREKTGRTWLRIGITVGLSLWAAGCSRYHPSTVGCGSNKGGCAQACTDSFGGYSCSCASGYKLASDGLGCDDIDECAAGTSGCARTCTNTPGGFSCDCPTGYTLAADGLSCDDVDECAAGTSGCAQTCTNTAGGFTCSCASGYTLAADGLGCDDVDECATANGGCAQTCTNTLGGHACSCTGDYQLAADGSCTCPASGTACNHAPVATTTAASGWEDTPMVVPLTYTDQDGDPAYAYVDALAQPGTAALQGTLYQYNETLAAGGSADAAVKIASFPARVTDVQGRVIFVPPTNANSDGQPEGLTIAPALTYHVEEASCCSAGAQATILLSSAPVTVPLDVQAVNDAPAVWTEADGQPGVCWEGCVVDEDSGWLALYAGGTDVEGDPLSVVITASTCPSGSLFELDGKTEVTAGTSLAVASGALAPALLFRPLADGYGADYCTVTYEVSDGLLDSVATNTIDVSVTNVNDAPVLEEESFTVWEDETTDLTLAAYDADADALTVTFASCTAEADAGTLSYLDPETLDDVALDCTDPAFTPIELDAAAGAASWTLRYTPAAANFSGDTAVVLQVELSDGVETTVQSVTIDVKPVNDSPLLSVDGLTYVSELEETLSAQVGESVPFHLSAMDVDSGQGIVSFHATASGGVIQWSPDKSLVASEVVSVIAYDDRLLEFTAPQDMMSALVSTIGFKASLVGAYSFAATLSDNGYTGWSPVENADGSRDSSAPLTATANITVNVLSTGSP